MGRTVPSFRAALESYIKELSRVASLIEDGDRRRMLQELLEHAGDLENEFVAVGGRPEEEVFLSLLLYAYSGSRRYGGCDDKDGVEA